MSSRCGGRRRTAARSPARVRHGDTSTALRSCCCGPTARRRSRCILTARRARWSSGTRTRVAPPPRAGRAGRPGRCTAMCRPRRRSATRKTWSVRSGSRRCGRGACVPVSCHAGTSTPAAGPTTRPPVRSRPPGGAPGAVALWRERPLCGRATAPPVGAAPARPRARSRRAHRAPRPARGTGLCPRRPALGRER